MRNFSPSSSEFTTVPIGQIGYAVKGVGSTLKWDPAKSERIFDALREDEPLAAPKPKPKGPAPVRVPVDLKQIRVQVENGTHTRGLGKRVDDALAATGFRTTRVPRNATDRAVQRTVVAFDPRWDRSAKSLAAALPGSELRPVRGPGPDAEGGRGRRLQAGREGEAGGPAAGVGHGGARRRGGVREEVTRRGPAASVAGDGDLLVVLQLLDQLLHLGVVPPGGFRRRCPRPACSSTCPRRR